MHDSCVNIRRTLGALDFSLSLSLSLSELIAQANIPLLDFAHKLSDPVIP
jgi:hypothetical protein